ncbi:MAG: phage portal protein, partial [Chloroflexi bacterium]|nr:phage portal protein [Chloroflexota bacterium]
GVWRIASKYSLPAGMVASLYKVKPKEKTAGVIEVWTAQDFELWIDNAQVEKKPNPYSFIPFIVYPNLREPKKFWGTSDLSQIIEPQRELNRATSQLSKILELSGNPIAVLENVEESEDIAVRPGAVWNIPEDAKAYLLDLLQGGGVNLHIDYINLLYRILHDVSESPRAAFGGTERDLSGVALEIELQPLLQKVKRKRLIRTAVYNQRNRLVLKLLEKFRNESFGDNHLRVVWGPVLPQDLAKLVANEQILIQTGIHSRRRAMDELGVKDPEMEFKQWLEERETILRMNKDLRPPRGAARVREPRMEVIEEPLP